MKVMGSRSRSSQSTRSEQAGGCPSTEGHSCLVFISLLDLNPVLVIRLKSFLTVITVEVCLDIPQFVWQS